MLKFITLTPEQKERFLSYTTLVNNGCLLWTGTVSGNYGRFSVNSKGWLAHHIGFILHHGMEIPDGMVVRHNCPGFHNPLCVNGAHLKLGTHKENMADANGQNALWRRKGEASYLSILTDAQVSQIKTYLISGEFTQTELGQKFQVNPRTINAIRQGQSWRHIDPQIPSKIPKPHRTFLDEEYTDMRNKWKEGWKLKHIAAFYNCRVDTVQCILSGKRGKHVPMGERIYRQHHHLLTDEKKSELRKLVSEGMMQKDAALMFGVSKSTVGNIMHPQQIAA